jgi:hypothetical protein
MLQACAPLISHSLSYIYNHSLHTGIFPYHPKTAVTRNETKVEWQITGLSHYEQFLRGTWDSYAQQIKPTFVYTNIKLVTEQYGFRKGMSNEDAFRLTIIVFKSINHKM